MIMTPVHFIMFQAILGSVLSLSLSTSVVGVLSVNSGAFFLVAVVTTGLLAYLLFCLFLYTQVLSFCDHNLSFF